VQTETSFHREHELRIPGQRDAVLGDGLTDGRGLAIPHGLPKTFYIKGSKVFHCVNDERAGVLALEQHHPQRHQAIKFSIRLERVLAVDRFGHCANREAEQQRRHEWDAWVHGT
jgi:hypothetical protein